jgi:hypothetical protein
MDIKEITVLQGTDPLTGTLTTFSKNYLDEDLKPLTEASPLAIGGTQEVILNRLQPEDVEAYLLMNTIVPRGIELKANRMVERGYIVAGDNEEYVNYCKQILENSGDSSFLKKIICNAYAFGFGPATLVPNAEQTDILRCNLEHPVYFRIAKYPKDYKEKALQNKNQIDKNTKKPMAFSQYRFNENKELIPYGKEIKSDMVVYMVFDTWGDECEGTSVFQYLQKDIKYLMNIDEGGAETMYRNGFNQKKLTTHAKTQKQMDEIAKNVKNINLRDVIILPDGSDVTNLIPGSTDFRQYHDVFVNNIAIRLGIPLVLLTQDGKNATKSTLREQRKDMRSDFGADELLIKQAIEEQLFYSACKFKYGDSLKPELVPKFFFKEIEEDKETRVEILVKQAQYITGLTDAIIKLKQAGLTDVSDKISEFLQNNVTLDLTGNFTQEYNKSKNNDNLVKKPTKTARIKEPIVEKNKELDSENK